MRARAFVGLLGLCCLVGCHLSQSERLLNEADRLYEKGDLDGAAERFARVLDSDPDNPRAIHGTAVVHYTRKEYIAALALFDRAIELDEENAAYRLHRGDTRLRLREFDGAIEDYEAALRLDPSQVRAYYSIGIAYYNERDYANAVRWLKRYLDAAPRADDRDRVEELIHSLRDWS